MDDQQPTAAHELPRGLSRGRRLAVVVADLVLAPVLAFVGFSFAFFGVGLPPDGGTSLGLREVLVLLLYLVVLVTVLSLPVGALLTWLAGRSDRSVLERRAAVIPLALAAVSAIILIGLAVAGFGFDQLVGI